MVSQGRVQAGLLAGGHGQVPAMNGQLGDLLIGAAARRRSPAARHRDVLVQVGRPPHRHQLGGAVPELRGPVLAELVGRRLPIRGGTAGGNQEVTQILPAR